MFIACNNVLVRNCKIYNIGYQRRAEHDRGIYFYAANDIAIDSNNINGVHGGGLHLYVGQDVVRSRNYLIINSIFENNKYGMVLTSAGYLRCYACTLE